MAKNALTSKEWNAFLQSIKENQNEPVGSRKNSLIPYQPVVDSKIYFTTAQVYDPYTRDHIIGDNSLVGYVLVVLEDAICCHGVYEGEAGGHRSFSKTDTLLIDMEPTNLDELINILQDESTLEHINGMQNENDNVSIQLILKEITSAKR